MTDPNTGTTSTTEQAREKAGEVVGAAGDRAAATAGEAKERATDVAAVATSQLTDVVGVARQELRDRAGSEAADLGGRLGEVAEELRAMSRASSEQGGTTAGLVAGVADQVDRGAQRLAEGDLDRAVDDVKRFARNRPGIFLLGALGAGFAVGRLLRHADLKELGQAARPGEPDVGDTATDPGPTLGSAPAEGLPSGGVR